ncbi:MAG: hypothetical protein ACJ76H_12660 [Bacteriovoracaceae bacterium]
MENQDKEPALPQSGKHGQRRVYQYATGRGGVPIGKEKGVSDEGEQVDYQYATGRGGVHLEGLGHFGQKVKKFTDILKEKLGISK